MLNLNTNKQKLYTLFNDFRGNNQPDVPTLRTEAPPQQSDDNLQYLHERCTTRGNLRSSQSEGHATADDTV